MLYMFFKDEISKIWFKPRFNLNLMFLNSKTQGIIKMSY